MLIPTGTLQITSSLKKALPFIKKKEYVKASNLFETILKNTVHNYIYLLVKTIISVLQYAQNPSKKYELDFKYETQINEFYSINSFNTISYMKKIKLPEELTSLFEIYKDTLSYTYYVYMCLNYDKNHIVDYYTKKELSQEEAIYLGFIQNSPVSYFTSLKFKKTDEEQKLFSKYILGCIYHYKLDHYKACEKVYNEILKINSIHIPTLYKLGCLYYFKKDNISKAEEYYKKILTIDPTYSFAIYSLAEINHINKKINYLTFCKETELLVQKFPNESLFTSGLLELYKSKNKDKNVEKCCIKLVTMDHSNIV